jgi:predicted MFS family arabinose efflux permease
MLQAQHPKLTQREQISPEDQRPLLIALGAGVFMVNLDSRVVAPLLPVMAADLHVSLSQAGWLVSAYMLPYGLLQLAYGPLADRIGKINVCAHAMAAFSVGTAFCAYWPSFPIILALRAFTGAAAAGLIPLTLAYVGDTVPYERRQATLTALMASAGAAQSFSTGAGGSITAALSWQAVFPFLGVLSLLITLGLYATRKRAIHVRRQGISFRVALRSAQLPSLLALVATEGFLYMGAFSYLSGLCHERFGLDALAIGLIMALTGAAQLLAASVLPRIVKDRSERTSLLWGGCTIGLSYLACAFAPHWSVVALACAGLGFGFIQAHTTLQLRATEIVPASRATALALFAFSLFVGSGVGAVAFGALLARVGFTGMFAVSGLGLMAFTALALKLLAPR